MLRQCPICNKLLELEENFYRIAGRNANKEYYYSYCKECTKNKSKLWAINNPEKAAQFKRKNQKN